MAVGQTKLICRHLFESRRFFTNLLIRESPKEDGLAATEGLVDGIPDPDFNVTRGVLYQHGS